MEIFWSVTRTSGAFLWTVLLSQAIPKPARRSQNTRLSSERFPSSTRRVGCIEAQVRRQISLRVQAGQPTKFRARIHIRTLALSKFIPSVNSTSVVVDWDLQGTVLHFVDMHPVV